MSRDRYGESSKQAVYQGAGFKPAPFLWNSSKYPSATKTRISLKTGHLTGFVTGVSFFAFFYILVDIPREI
jgi:hypothetical protein